MNVRTVFLLFMFAIGSCTAYAENYPSRPIRIVLPFPAGGSMDVVARLVADKLRPVLPQPVVLDYRPGAAGIIGTDHVAKSPPDGYTLVLVAPSHAINPFTYKNLPYDPVEDFTPVVLYVIAPLVLAVNADVPARDVKELIALAKAHPGKINFGSASAGGIFHLSGELFNSMGGVRTVHVPYKGVAPATTDLLAGRIQMMFSSLVTLVPYLASGRIRTLAIASGKRSSLAPDLPTMAEAGLPGFEAYTWYGLLAPQGTPRANVELLARAIDSVLNTPSMRQELKKYGVEPAGGTPEDLAAFMERDMTKWAKIIKERGITTN